MSSSDQTKSKNGPTGMSRRELLRTAVAAVVIGGMSGFSFAQSAAGNSSISADKGTLFPEKFLWGCATAAHQQHQ